MMTENQLRYFVALMKKCEELGLRPNRTQLHKISFFVKHRVGQEVPFDFALYSYGPYSFGLDDAVQELADSSDLTLEYDSGGYGALYSLDSQRLDEIDPVSQDVDEALGRWVDALGHKGVRELELYATSLYVAREKSQASRQEQIQAVQKIKPHFSESAIARAFEWLEQKHVIEKPA